MSSILTRLVNLVNNVTGVLRPANGGTGVANNAASTLTINGAYSTAFTVSNITSLTLPTSGTLATNAVVVPGTSAGLVSASGVPGNTTGSAIAVGFVGEVISAVTASANVSATGVGSQAVTITLTAGIWLVSGSVTIVVGSATFSPSYDVYWALSGTPGNSFTGENLGQNAWEILQTVAPPRFSCIVPAIYVRSDGTNIYINEATTTSTPGTSFNTQVVGIKLLVNNYSAATPTFRSRLQAIRVA
jgi:hypothetical protein